VTDKHQAYVRAVRRHARHAAHSRTGLHRARGETTKPVERRHVPIKDRLRPMRGAHRVARRPCAALECIPLDALPARTYHADLVGSVPWV
jgi:hypothetical protein